MSNISEELYSDNEQKFYSKFLSSFENIETDEKLVQVDDELTKIFDEFGEIFFNSSAINENSEFVDSFVFFIACDVINCQNGNYYINLENLSKKAEDYRKSCKDGICKRKGTI